MQKPSPIDSGSFRRILSEYPTGVCVIAALTAERRPVGMVVGSFTAVSLDPILVGFFPDGSSSTWPQIEAAGKFCVNVLAGDQTDLVSRFATRGGDKFSGLAHRWSDNGSPLLNDVIAWIDCDIHAVHSAGDHFLVLGEVKAMGAGRSTAPLIFHRNGYAQPGPLPAGQP